MGLRSPRSIQDSTSLSDKWFSIFLPHWIHCLSWQYIYTKVFHFLEIQFAMYCSFAFNIVRNRYRLQFLEDFAFKFGFIVLALTFRTLVQVELVFFFFYVTLRRAQLHSFITINVYIPTYVKWQKQTLRLYIKCVHLLKIKCLETK